MRSLITYSSYSQTSPSQRSSQLVTACLHFCLIKVGLPLLRVNSTTEASTPASFISGRLAQACPQFEWMNERRCNYPHFTGEGRDLRERSYFSRSQPISRRADAWTQVSSWLVLTTPMLSGRTVFLPFLGNIILSLGTPAWRGCPRQTQGQLSVIAETPGGCHS